MLEILIVIILVFWSVGATFLIVSGWRDEEDVCWQPTPGEYVGHVCRVFPNRKNGHCKICGRGKK